LILELNGYTGRSSEDWFPSSVLVIVINALIRYCLTCRFDYDSDYIDDIYTAINDVLDFTSGMTVEAFCSDIKTSNAVIRSLEVLGEATKHIPDEFRQKHPQIPWSKMAGMRDVLIHDYMGVDLITVWKVATERLPVLKTNMEKLILKP
jgi:uncharacterized protein with HEPN domain